MDGLYRAAPQLAARGERIVRTDELTGVQALERKHPGLPLAPGRVERREFAYVRHGTRTFILNRAVVSGQVVAPSCGPTRTAADFLDHIRRTVATDPDATRWHFVVDNLSSRRRRAWTWTWASRASAASSRASPAAPPSSATRATAASSTTPPSTRPGSTRWKSG